MRKIQKLMNDWTFIYHDGSRTVLDLPHTWNAIDGQDGGNDYWRGTCSYEKTFAKPEFDAESELVYLQFHGVNASAKVVLNGKEVCTHDGGYSTFRKDVTTLLEDKNHLVVYVDNSVNDRVYPQKADFTFYGGIYRDVELLTVSKTHFELDYFAGPGIKVTPEVKGNDAEILVETWTNGEGDVKVTLLDAEGNAVTEGKGTKALLNVKDVHIWNGVADPYLYCVKAELSVDGKVVDEVSTTCGVRYFSFDPDKGFYLNGRPYNLHGVSRHQDFKGIGNAITKEHHDRDMELIREVGANTVRLAHYQHDQYFYNLCDKYGMVVWAEIPYISEHLANGDANTESQMKELIVQNYNHPCIVMWGLSNEITISGRSKRKQMLANHRALQKLVKEMDPTRVTTLACFAVALHWEKSAHISDIVAWNLYLGWYVPGFFLNDLWIKFWKFLYPNRCLGFSEYGAEGMPNLHSAKPKRGDNTEEYQNKYHEFMLECFKRHPYMWGNYVWNMFDFAADARNQGGEPGMNHKGLVTFDRKLKKDCFYLYRAYWTEEPFVYMAGRRYEYRTEAVTEITVYSTCKEVSLYNNGKLVETKSGDHVFKFKMPMEETNHLEVKSGDCVDSVVIYKTD
ncbi:MAG: glycoside hydrolase family 2 protein, partial [Lachnospiraceae bacterium]|nr:glycoside hydrolase family 2 protein [Lachnospiraceae bacterium]